VLTFGPVPSRRLGRSLGINNIPPKACSYSCVYCQVGPTRATEIVPRKFYTPDQIYQEVVKHLVQTREKDDQVDYLTFVPDGEPTLDSRLSEICANLWLSKSDSTKNSDGIIEDSELLSKWLDEVDAGKFCGASRLVLVAARLDSYVMR